MTLKVTAVTPSTVGYPSDSWAFCWQSWTRVPPGSRYNVALTLSDNCCPVHLSLRRQPKTNEQ